MSLTGALLAMVYFGPAPPLRKKRDLAPLAVAGARTVFAQKMLIGQRLGYVIRRWVQLECFQGHLGDYFESERVLNRRDPARTVRVRAPELR